MKKLKFLVLLLVALLSLCSCAELDEMKDCHALDYGNGIIKYKSDTYKELEYSGVIVVERAKDLYITEPDVPVLLSQSEFVIYLPYINSDNTIIYNDGYYIREDKYDYFVSQIENGINYVKHSYYSPNADYSESNQTVYFDNEQLSVFNSFLNSVTPVISNEPLFTFDYIWLTSQSADGYFVDEIYEIIKYNGSYGVIQYTDTDEYYLYLSNEKYDGFFSSVFDTIEIKE